MTTVCLRINNIVRVNNKDWIILNNGTFFTTPQTRLIQLNQHVVLQQMSSSNNSQSNNTVKKRKKNREKLCNNMYSALLIF